MLHDYKHLAARKRTGNNNNNELLNDIMHGALIAGCCLLIAGVMALAMYSFINTL